MGKGSFGKIVIAVLMMVFALNSKVFAADKTSAYDPSESHIGGMLTKLGRGATNIATSPLEILKVTSRVTNEEGFLAGTVFGSVEGVFRGLVRLGAGVFEVGTFFVEIPKGYGPIVKPEYVYGNLQWQGEGS